MRIERIEKEQEKYRIYQDVDPEIIDQAQKRLGAKAQITRTLEKYRRALEELNHRIQELNNLYRTLEVSGADEETLSQFDLMFERHKNLEQLRDELYQLQIKRPMLHSIAASSPRWTGKSWKRICRNIAGWNR